ncbi:MAG: SemiSWEET transporter [Candidatus Aureabacteria bacterium]|nr:SemiSWEET transporter [Candidatus Auribacterota bacterium]
MTPLIIGLCAGSLCVISFLPQVIKIFRTKNTRDLSLITFSLFSLGVFLWLIYGILIKSLPVILTNAAMAVLTLLIVVMKVRYK